MESEETIKIMTEQVVTGFCQAFLERNKSKNRKLTALCGNYFNTAIISNKEKALNSILKFEYTSINEVVLLFSHILVLKGGKKSTEYVAFGYWEGIDADGDEQNFFGFYCWTQEGGPKRIQTIPYKKMLQNANTLKLDKKEKERQEKVEGFKEEVDSFVEMKGAEINQMKEEFEQKVTPTIEALVEKKLTLYVKTKESLVIIKKQVVNKVVAGFFEAFLKRNKEKKVSLVVSSNAYFQTEILLGMKAKEKVLDLMLNSLSACRDQIFLPFWDTMILKGEGKVEYAVFANCRTPDTAGDLEGRFGFFYWSNKGGAECILTIPDTEAFEGVSNKKDKANPRQEPENKNLQRLEFVEAVSQYFPQTIEFEEVVSQYFPQTSDKEATKTVSSGTPDNGSKHLDKEISSDTPNKTTQTLDKEATQAVSSGTPNNDSKILSEEGTKDLSSSLTENKSTKKVFFMGKTSIIVIFAIILTIVGACLLLLKK